jgi:hypothetical protein
VLTGLEAERAGHAAAAGVGVLDLQAELLQHLLHAIPWDERLLVAVPVEKSLPTQRRQAVEGAVAHQQLAQQEDLLGEAPGVFVVGEEVDQLVAEDRRAARLQAHHRRAGPDLVPQLVEDLPERDPTDPVRTPTAPEPERSSGFRDCPPRAEGTGQTGRGRAAR